MRRLVLLVCMFSLGFNSATKAGTPVAHWSLDETTGTIAHESIQLKHGTLHNFNFTSGSGWVAGKIGGALAFDGVNDYISTAVLPPTGNSPRTIAFWATTTVSTREMVGASYGGDAWDSGKSFRTSFNHECEGVSINFSMGTETYSAEISDGNWHHYAWVLPQGASRLNEVNVYMDGTKLTRTCFSQSGFTLNTSSERTLDIGAYYPNLTGGGFFFEGLIDDVRIYNYALSEAEIEAIAGGPEESWSFAIITDPHIGKRPRWYGDWYDYNGEGWNDGSGGEENLATRNLRTAVEAINENREKYNIKFVVVTGDLSDSAELSEFEKFKDIFSDLEEIPWIPLIGNHDVWPAAAGCAQIEDNIDPDFYFHDKFDQQYDDFPNELGVSDSWKKWGELTWNSNLNRYNYFQNFAFDYKEYHFVGLDFNYRGKRPSWFPDVPYTWPQGKLYDDLDNEKGTWDWFTGHIEEYTSTHSANEENIILFAHHPFRNFKEFDLWLLGEYVDMGFSQKEMNMVFEFLKQYKDRIWCQFAGHSHRTNDRLSPQGVMQIVETDETHSAPLVRLVHFYPDGRRFYSGMLPEDNFIAMSFGPVDLEVTDPDGFTIDKYKNEIQGAFYYEEIDPGSFPLDYVYIPKRKLGHYQIKTIREASLLSMLLHLPASEGLGNSTPTYTLKIAMCEDSSGYVPISIAKDVPLEDIPAGPYVFEVKEREPVHLAYIGDSNGHHFGTVTLSAQLTDGIGVSLANKNVGFELGTWSASAVTDSNGVAAASATLDQVPGVFYSVDVSFSGDEDYLPANDSEPFTIAPPSVDDYVDLRTTSAGYNHRTAQLSVDIQVVNTSSRAVDIPLWLVLETISDSNTCLADADGTTPDGKEYIDLSDLLLDDGKLNPNETITKQISFNNPQHIRFTFGPSVRGVIVEEPAPGPLGQLSGLATHWLGSELSLDIVPAGGDGIVNFRDFSLIAEAWLNRE